MGHGSYSHEAHKIISEAYVGTPRQEVFKQRTCHAMMNPKDVRVRESRDSADHPSSLAVVFALDVTGSMGKIPELLAREELPAFMKVLVDCKVDDPQLLFMAVGDATSDAAPLQVGQFESTAELMDRWLTWTFLEGKGGAGDHESYELGLYFLAEHTDMDCWVKRKKRGYVFMTGDELPYPAVSRHQVETLVGDKLDEDVPVEAVVAALQKTFHPFFLIPDQKRRARCEATWRALLGDNVIAMYGPEDTCYVAAGLVALTERVVPDLDAVARVVEEAGAPKERVGSVVRALTPYAATLGKDGAPPLRADPAGMPSGDGASLWQRIKNGLK
jgi:hypothetical protein